MTAPQTHPAPAAVDGRKRGLRIACVGLGCLSLLGVLAVLIAVAIRVSVRGRNEADAVARVFIRVALDRDTKHARELTSREWRSAMTEADFGAFVRSWSRLQGPLKAAKLVSWQVRAEARGSGTLLRYHVHGASRATIVMLVLVKERDEWRVSGCDYRLGTSDRHE